MNVKEFVEKYNGFSNETLKNNFVRERIVNEYVPYTKKMNICDNIVKATSTAKYKVGDEEKDFFSVNSAIRYMLFQVRVIENYTDITFGENEAGIEDFELLDQYGLNEVLTSAIPEREYANFKVLLDMYFDDYTINENNFIKYLDTKIGALGMSMDVFSDAFLNIINSPEAYKILEGDKEE